MAADLITLSHHFLRTSLLPLLSTNRKLLLCTRERERERERESSRLKSFHADALNPCCDMISGF